MADSISSCGIGHVAAQGWQSIKRGAAKVFCHRPVTEAPVSQKTLASHARDVRIRSVDSTASGTGEINVTAAVGSTLVPILSNVENCPIMAEMLLHFPALKSASVMWSPSIPLPAGVWHHNLTPLLSLRDTANLARVSKQTRFSIATRMEVISDVMHGIHGRQKIVNADGTTLPAIAPAKSSAELDVLHKNISALSPLHRKQALRDLGNVMDARKIVRYRPRIENDAYVIPGTLKKFLQDRDPLMIQFALQRIANWISHGIDTVAQSRNAAHEIGNLLVTPLAKDVLPTGVTYPSFVKQALVAPDLEVRHLGIVMRDRLLSNFPIDNRRQIIQANVHPVLILQISNGMPGLQVNPLYDDWLTEVDSAKASINLQRLLGAAGRDDVQGARALGVFMARNLADMSDQKAAILVTRLITFWPMHSNMPDCRKAFMDGFLQSSKRVAQTSTVAEAVRRLGIAERNLRALERYLQPLAISLTYTPHRTLAEFIQRTSLKGHDLKTMDKPSVLNLVRGFCSGNAIKREVLDTFMASLFSGQDIATTSASRR